MNVLEVFKKWPYSPRETWNIWLFLLPKLLNVFFCILMWFMAFFFVMAAVLAFRNYLFVNRAVKTEAVILDYNFSSGRSSKIILRFEDRQGKAHQFISTTGHNPPLGKPGEVVEILYDPENPVVAKENTYRALWSTGNELLYASLKNFLIFGALYLFTRRILKKQVQDVTIE